MDIGLDNLVEFLRVVRRILPELKVKRPDSTHRICQRLGSGL